MQGNAITCPSLFSDCCSQMIRKSENGYNRCLHCDMRGADDASRTGKPAIYECHAGLIDIAAPVMLNGKHIGAIYGGQVLTEPPREDKFRKIAVELGIDPEEYVAEIKKLPVLSEETIHALASTLHSVASNFSTVAHQQIKLQAQNRELVQLDRWLKSLFGTISDVVLVSDTARKIVRVNKMAEEVIGKTSAELLNKPIGEFIHNQVPDLERFLKSREDFTDIEVLMDTSGGCIKCLSSNRLIKDEQGRISGGILILHPLEKLQPACPLDGSSAPFTVQDIIGESPEIQELKLNIARLANTTSTILLEGESGTGKEVIAQAIHNEGIRRHGPFIAVNCGAIPQELINSELFGYTEGAFTGAKKGGNPGKFELASGGTIFLDEIGDMPLEQQVVLLRVLQEKKVTRVGGGTAIPIDVRVICATNKQLQNEIIKGNFRQDLYYRLNILSLYIPPLRERSQDIPLLFHHFLNAINSGCGKRYFNIEPEFMKCLREYSWPGNVRELQNITERVFYMAENDTLTVRSLPPEIVTNKMGYYNQESAPVNHSDSTQKRNKWRELKAQQEAQKIQSLLEENGGNVSQVAKVLGISRNSLYRKINLYNITPRL